MNWKQSNATGWELWVGKELVGFVFTPLFGGHGYLARPIVSHAENPYRHFDTLEQAKHHVELSFQPTN